ncbi:MAG: Crp/Fnr family transcriptional regulator [Bacteroidota bacterium]
MADNSPLWFLENIDLQHLFCPRKTGRLDEKPHLDFEANTYVYLPDEPAEHIFLINSGRVKIGTYGEEGREITKAILGPGEVFGEMALIGQEERRDFAFAVEDLNLCTLDRSDLTTMMRERSELQLFFMKLIGNRTLRLERRLENLVFKSSRTRIVEFLHELARNKGREVGFEREVRQMLTHKEIADLTATSRQTVNSVMNDLRRKNIISFNRRRMLVRDLEALNAEV